MTPAIETFDLTRRFGRQDAVHELNLRVHAGSIFGLVGPNGAGKTTTIKLVLDLLRPTHGTATVLGMSSRQLRPQGFQRIGYVSENQRLPEHLTPAGLLGYCRPLYSTWDDELCRRLQVSLQIPMHTSLRVASRGTRMKAALLVALAFRPELVVLDEPFSGLDPLVRDELVQGLLEIASEQNVTVLVSSHDIEELERLADWIAYLDAGRLVFAEQVTSLLERLRFVEIVAHNDVPPRPVQRADWLIQGVAGRTLTFVDTRHDAPDALARIAAVYPDAEVRTSTPTLREMFVILARSSRVAVPDAGGGR